MPVVVDSSALVELLIQSERAPAVIQALGTTDWVAPDAVNPEVLSALRRMERGGLAAGRVAKAVDDLLDAPLRRYPTLPLMPEAWRLRADITATDACYVVLARILHCPLVTGDLRLSRAAGLGVPLVTV